MKTIFITGGSRGIGAGIVKVLSKASYNIVIGYSQNKDLAHALLDTCKTKNNAIKAIQINLEDSQSITDSIKNIQYIVHHTMDCAWSFSCFCGRKISNHCFSASNRYFTQVNLGNLGNI